MKFNVLTRNLFATISSPLTNDLLKIEAGSAFNNRKSSVPHVTLHMSIWDAQSALAKLFSGHHHLEFDIVVLHVELLSRFYLLVMYAISVPATTEKWTSHIHEVSPS